MTTATTLNLKRLLAKLVQSKSSGCLEIEGESVVWKIYLQKGHVKYVHCSVQNLDQLRYHLHYFEWKQAVIALKHIPESLMKISSSAQDKSASQNIYSKVIPWLLTDKHLDLSQGIRLIENITKDYLSICLWLEKGTSQWHEGHPISDWIPVLLRNAIAINIPEFIQEELSKLKQWQQCSVELRSSYQRPYFSPGWETKSLPSEGSLDLKTLQELSHLLRGRTSIRQLSILLRKKEVYVGKILSPYIDKKIIYLHHSQSPFDKLPTIPRLSAEVASPTVKDSLTNNSGIKTWKIICIDDSPTILQEIKRFLDQDKFSITAIDDPVKAVPQVFTIQPDLILLDITMPRINGYKLCGLLRSSGKCDDLPIIMVTGNTGLIDKARAKIAGATDYFTKPFTKEGLTQIIEKHLT